jgi:tetratricopeptide (TPR) repeat protein
MSTEYSRAAAGGTEYEADAPPAAGVDRPVGDPTVPRAIGRFRVEGLLGRGGMGVVYKARDPNMGDREVALKVVSRARFDEFGLSQLRGETEKMARVRHPNILTVYESGLDAATGETFIVMEYAPGGSLARRLNKEPQRSHLAAGLAETLATAVQAVHALDLIHRDLKPQNVLLTDDADLRPAVLKITDFGLATSLAERDGRPTRLEVAGTPEYMAPEQTRPGEPLTAAVDVYALGVILYEMLTGRHPFPRGVPDASSGTAKKGSRPARPSGPTPGRGSQRTALDEQFHRIRWDDPVPPRRLSPRLDRDLETVCLKCLQKDPGKRYATAGELADDLRRYLNRESIKARPAPWWERGRRLVNRYPWPATLAATVAAGVFAGVGFVVYKNRDFRQQIAALTASYEDLNKQREERDAKHQAELAAEHEKSQAALDRIRDSVLYEDLRQVGGLEPLTDTLRKFYDEARKDGDPRPDAPEAAVRKTADRSAKLGDLFDKTGDKGKAEEEYSRAARLYARVGAAADEAAARLDRGRVLVGLPGGRFAEAAAEFDEAERLLKELPADRQLTLERAEVWHQRGVLHGAKVERDRAVAAYDEADKLRKGLYEALPKGEGERDRPDHLWVRRDYGRTFGFRGDDQLENGRLAEADADYWLSHKVRAEIADVPAARPAAGGPRHAYRHDPLAAKFELARAWFNFVNFHGRNRSPQTAAHFAQEGLKLLVEVVADRPNVSEYKSDLGAAYNRLAELALRSGDRAGAATQASKAIKVYEPLNKRFPADPSFAQGLGTAYALTAAALAADGRESPRRAEANPFVLTAFALLDPLAKSAVPRPDARFYRAMTLALAAELGLSPPGAAGTTALDALADAVEKGYRGRHPRDVAEDPLFRDAVRKLGPKRFDAVVQEMSDPPAPARPPATST